MVGVLGLTNGLGALNLCYGLFYSGDRSSIYRGWDDCIATRRRTEFKQVAAGNLDIIAILCCYPSPNSRLSRLIDSLLT